MREAPSLQKVWFVMGVLLFCLVFGLLFLPKPEREPEKGRADLTADAVYESEVNYYSEESAPTREDVTAPPRQPKGVPDQITEEDGVTYYHYIDDGE